MSTPTTTSGRIAFREVGEAFKLATHAHLTMDLDLMVWKKACDRMVASFSGYTANLTALFENKKGKGLAVDAVEEEYAFAMAGIREEVVMVCEPLAMVTDMAEEGFLARSKRQLLAFLGGTIMGIFSLFSLANVGQNDLEANQHHMLVGIRSNLHRIGLLEADMTTLHQTLDVALGATNHLFYAVDALHKLDRVKAVANVFIRRVEVVTDVIDHLYDQKLSPKALSRPQLTSAMASIESAASKVGFKVAFNHPTDVFQSPASFLLGHDGNMRIFVHVAVHASADRPMTLYEYIRSPIAIHDDIYAIVEDEADFLMVSYDLAWSQAVTAATLATCRHLGAVYVCEEPQVFRRNMSSYCLGAMFMGDDAAMEARCKISFHRNEASVVPIAKGRFVLFHPKRTAGIVNCPGEQTTRVLYSGLEDITLDTGCEVVTQDFGFQNAPKITGVDLGFRIMPLELPRNLLLKDVVREDLHKAMDILATVGKDRPSDAEVRNVLKELDAVKWPAHLHMGATIALIASAGIMLLVLGFLFVRYKKHFRRSSDNTNVEDNANVGNINGADVEATRS